MSSWTITWGDQSWTDDDLTGQHLATLALISGDDRFESLSLTADEVVEYPSEGYMRLMFMLSAFVTVHVCNGLDDDDEAQEATTLALTDVQSSSADSILASIRFGTSAVPAMVDG